MKNKITKSLCVLFAIFMLSACKIEKEQESKLDSIKTEVEDTRVESEEDETEKRRIQIEKMRVEENKVAEDGTLLFQKDCYFPLISIADNKEAEAKINDYYEKEQEQVDKESEDYKKMVEENYEENKEWVNFTITSDFTVTRQDDNLLSIRTLEYMYYTQAAHPNTAVRAQTFDVTTGLSISLTDFVEDENELAFFTELIEIIKKQIQEEEIGVYENYEEILDTSKENASKDMTWYLTDTAFVIVFNPYVIAPHTGGILEFEVPFSECESYLNKEGKQLLEIS